jgi:hypothetical protein
MNEWKYFLKRMAGRGRSRPPKYLWNVYLPIFGKNMKPTDLILFSEKTFEKHLQGKRQSWKGERNVFHLVLIHKALEKRKQF